MFQDAHMDTQTHARRRGRTGQNHYAFGHTTLGGGTKIVVVAINQIINQFFQQGAAMAKIQ